MNPGLNQFWGRGKIFKATCKIPPKKIPKIVNAYKLKGYTWLS